MSEPEIIMINTDILKSVIYTMGAFIFVLFGVIWKMLAIGFKRFEDNIVKTIQNCHNELDDYAKTTREKTERIDRWTSDHIEKFHT